MTLAHTADNSVIHAPHRLHTTALAPLVHLVIDEHGQVRYTPLVTPGMQIIARPLHTDRLAA